MPTIFCEVCDYYGRGKTLRDQLLDVIQHEEKLHCRHNDVRWLEEELEDAEDNPLEED